MLYAGFFSYNLSDLLYDSMWRLKTLSVHVSVFCKHFSEWRAVLLYYPITGLNENVLQKVAILADPLNTERGILIEPCECM